MGRIIPTHRTQQKRNHSAFKLFCLFSLLSVQSYANEVDAQFKALEFDLTRTAHFEKVADETFHPAALVTKADGDPLDIILRRTKSLLDDISKMPDAPDMIGCANKLQSLNKQAKTSNDRKALFAEVHALRRDIAFANPLLNFEKILFIKRHRSNFSHMCDQYYGAHARPGGGVFVLSNPFGDNPQAKNILPEGALKGGSFLSPELSFDGKQVMFAYVDGTGDPKHIVHLEHERGHWDEGCCYHLFSATLDSKGNGSNLKQLTDGTFNDFDPCYLPTAALPSFPNGAAATCAAGATARRTPSTT